MVPMKKAACMSNGEKVYRKRPFPEVPGELAPPTGESLTVCSTMARIKKTARMSNAGKVYCKQPSPEVPTEFVPAMGGCLILCSKWLLSGRPLSFRNGHYEEAHLHVDCRKFLS
ncbi:hypothetical protein KIN20_037214 [Parelaphostrongylus tenuis]|uniref:Uncharacterized protein n=1 Tax=Parelaphostrongylus tenuis TaxID=148309 RepID=A0AAD5R3E1_PARTN|nr:hypothetical protein KIN20_023816 [Parelaphostrongylus tenuis]KAJ1363867.1 hypothetical protein KIN20_023819 [Parelaphostrongylus tenuis]KAJ1365091.1 hypothetical protein KIN20_025315 [Parelaphostrongylus tenuis]KAJ1368791.1 hypothetical protein KIN20_030116 [Parelaphostrongylus tenuis]KAJ1374512.1 hypothetical protein KIN20_037214 [Parelaphostrongylus tenuis]